MENASVVQELKLRSSEGRVLCPVGNIHDANDICIMVLQRPVQNYGQNPYITLNRDKQAIDTGDYNHVIAGMIGVLPVCTFSALLHCQARTVGFLACILACM